VAVRVCAVLFRAALAMVQRFQHKLPQARGCIATVFRLLRTDLASWHDADELMRVRCSVTAMRGSACSL
jgi:hypothetical protein